MKFSWGWVCDYLTPTPDALSRVEEVLTQAGLEVEDVIDEKSFAGLEVVKVGSVSKHPSADHLSLCEVNSKIIVCGAKNVRAGMRTILANIGAVIPKTGQVLTETSIRGVSSEGMLCSPDELGLFGNDGIIELKEDDEIAHILLPNGPIFDINVTPNRGDLLSIYGIARELSAFGLGQLKDPSLYSLQLHFENNNSVVDIKDDSVSSMYTLDLRNLSHNVSPDWLKLRLQEVGINSKSCVVDITNYLAHALGQPLHAFDGEVVKHIDIEKYSQNDFTDLKGNIHNITDLSCMVANNQCVSIPGVIGANYGKCHENSQAILLEAATYTRDHIFKAQGMVAKTEASKKFFYGVDPEMTRIALLQAAAMVQNLCGCSFGKAVCATQQEVVKNQIPFPSKYLKTLKIGNEVGEKYLAELGFKKSSEKLFLTPSWRAAVSTEEDLLHEILRRYDINKVEDKTFENLGKMKPKSHRIDYLRNILISEGLFEVVSRDFMSKEMNEVFQQDEALILANPMSKTQFTLRNSILVSLIEFYDAYARYKWQSNGLFELGKIFTDELVEQDCLGLVLPIVENDWMSSNINSNFFNSKRIVEKCVKYLFGNNVTCVAGKAHKILRDTCEWKLPDGGIVATFGIFGKPEQMKALKIKSSFYMAEISLEEPKEVKNIGSTLKITDQETITKDLSVVMSKEVFVAEVINKIRSSESEVEVKIFDVYPNGLIEQNTRSVGLRLVWSSLEKTMTTEEIHTKISRIEDLIKELGCVVRES